MKPRPQSGPTAIAKMTCEGCRHFRQTHGVDIDGPRAYYVCAKKPKRPMHSPCTQRWCPLLSKVHLVLEML